MSSSNFCLVTSLCIKLYIPCKSHCFPAHSLKTKYYNIFAAIILATFGAVAPKLHEVDIGLPPLLSALRSAIALTKT